MPKQFKPSQSSNIGNIGEDAAVGYLLSHHFTIVTRNFKARYGEIDIIARENETLVFVEVKTRSNNAFGTPEESVTPKKLQEVVKTAQYYLHIHPRETASVRIDVIAVVLDPLTLRVSGLRHLKNVS